VASKKYIRDHLKRKHLPTQRIFNRSLTILALLAASALAWAQSSDFASQTAADNSKANQQDRSSAAPTADQQKNDRSDLQLTQQVRRSLTKDKSLSTYAHNIKVITQNGMVTLKGPVRSEEEKSAILAKAAEIAGKTNINDQLTVVPKSD
jgi:hyperosmotically inducible protein